MSHDRYFRLAALAGRQHAAFTREQSAACGLTARMVKTGIEAHVFIEEHQGVYRFAGAPVTWHQRVMLAVLAAGVGAVASHRCAAALWGLAGFRPGQPEVTVPRHRRNHMNRLARVHEKQDLEPRQVTRRDGIPVTSVVETLFGLAAVVGRQQLERAVDDALVRKLTTVDAIKAELALPASAGRRGVRALRAAIEIWRDGRQYESQPEARIARLLEAWGVGGFEPQVEIFDNGEFVARVDFCRRRDRRIIEHFGEGPHGPRTAPIDGRRLDRLRALGYDVMITRAADLRDGGRRLRRRVLTWQSAARETADLASRR